MTKLNKEEKIRKEFRKLQEINIDYGQLGKVKSYLLNEEQHNHIADFFLNKMQKEKKRYYEYVVKRLPLNLEGMASFQYIAVENYIERVKEVLKVINEK